MSSNPDDASVHLDTLPESEHLLKAHQHAVFPALPRGDLWVFGYGSLMWRPDFDYIEKTSARVYGYHRSLCVLSWVHRGTQSVPGLVLGLDKGGSCTGKLFRVSELNKESVAEYLYARELPTLVYSARIVKLHTLDGRCVNALTFVVDRDNPQYTKGKSDQQLAEIVSSAQGMNGSSSQYLLSTLEHLRADGIYDSKLEAIAKKL